MSQLFPDGQHLILFPSLAHYLESEEQWLADISGWSYDFDSELHLNRPTAKLLRRALKTHKNESDSPIFRDRAHGFLVETRKGTPIQVQNSNYESLGTTKRNGHFRGTYTFHHTNNEQTLNHTQFGISKISLQVRREDCEINAQGDIYLVPSEGISIVSDIDDTIKFSHVANRQELLANTFLRPFRSIQGMAEAYTAMARHHTSFHYISATPWQLFRSISHFLNEQHFPEGSIHLRKFSMKDVTFLKKLSPAHKKKRLVIESLIERYPHRSFYLIGDSGEKDPEVYADVARKFPQNVLGVAIRNVSDDSPESVRYRKAFLRIPTEKWLVFDQAGQLQDHFTRLSVDYCKDDASSN